jgi:hypothetical protein
MCDGPFFLFYFLQFLVRASSTLEIPFISHQHELDPAWKKVGKASRESFQELFWATFGDDAEGAAWLAIDTVASRDQAAAAGADRMPFILTPESIGAALDSIDARHRLADAPGTADASPDAGGDGMLAPEHVSEIENFVETVVLGLSFGECRRGMGCGKSCQIIEDSIRRVPTLSPGEGRALAKHREATLTLMRECKGKRAFALKIR